MARTRHRTSTPGAALVLATVAAATAAAWQSAETGGEIDNTASREAATAFLATLAPEQRSAAQLPFDVSERFNWHYVPRSRRGLAFKDMSEAQRAAADRLLRSALSDTGYEKAAAIIELENVLRDLESRPGRPALFRDPQRYWFTIFGEPGPEPWGWRVEGHHLSLNFSAVTNGVVAVTPSFMGANPAKVTGGPHDGLRVLADEEDLGRALLEALTEGQRRFAIIADRAPRDILMAPGREKLPDPIGLPTTRMKPEQQAVLSRLIDVYITRFRADLAAEWKIRVAADLPRVWFAWAGSEEPGEPHYYRVQGTTFMIEYDNAQNGANHVHTVWRDVDDDFGRDWLRKHLEEEHGHGAGGDVEHGH